MARSRAPRDFRGRRFPRLIVGDYFQWRRSLLATHREVFCRLKRAKPLFLPPRQFNVFECHLMLTFCLLHSFEDIFVFPNPLWQSRTAHSRCSRTKYKG